MRIINPLFEPSGVQIPKDTIFSILVFALKIWRKIINILGTQFYLHGFFSTEFNCGNVNKKTADCSAVDILLRIAATSSELKVTNPLFDYVRIINPNERKFFHITLTTINNIILIF